MPVESHEHELCLNVREDQMRMTCVLYLIARGRAFIAVKVTSGPFALCIAIGKRAAVTAAAALKAALLHSIPR